MPEARTSRGVFLPSFWQVLTVCAGLCAAWLVWSHGREPALTGDRPASDTSSHLENLQAIERITNRGADAVPELVELLTEPDAITRRHALFGLGRIGPEAADALDSIREKLTDENAEVRTYAMTAFWRVGRNPEQTATVTAPLLADPNNGVREDAATLLEALGPRAIDEVSKMLGSKMPAARILALQLLRLWEWDDENPELAATVRLLKDDPDPSVRPEAFATIVACTHPTMPEIRELLRKNIPVVNRNPRWGMSGAGMTPVGIALAAIENRGPEAAELLPDVLALLDNEPESRSRFGMGYPGSIWRVVPVLRAMKTAARPAVPRLRELFTALQGEDQHGRRDYSISIAETMFEVGADPDELVSMLTAILRNRKRPDRLDAGRLLCRVSPPAARQEAQRLISELADGGDPVDARDLFALEGLAQFASEAVPLLVNLVDDSEKSISETAIRTLGEIGPDAAPAVPALAGLLTRKPKNSRDSFDPAVATALGRIGPAARPAVAALLETIDRTDVELQTDRNLQTNEWYYRAAITALRDIGESNPRVLSVLCRQLSNRAVGVRSAAISALAQLGADSSDVLLVLERRLDDEDARVRVAATAAIASGSADAERVLSLLIQQLNDRDGGVRAHALLAIGRVHADLSPAIDALTVGLSDENRYVRSAAALTLGKIGPEAQSAIPALREMLHEPANWLRNRHYRPVDQPYAASSSFIPELANISIRSAARTALAQIDK